MICFLRFRRTTFDLTLGIVRSPTPEGDASTRAPHRWFSRWWHDGDGASAWRPSWSGCGSCWPSGGGPSRYQSPRSASSRLYALSSWASFSPALFGRKNHCELLPFHLGRALDLGDVGQFGCDPVHHGHAQLRMRDLPPAEHQRDLHLVFLLEESPGVTRLRVEVVVVDARPVLHFLELNDMLLFLRDPRLLGLLELELSEVHDPDHRRPRRGGNLHQVESVFFGQRHGLVDFHDSELCTVVTDHAYGTDADLFVDANAFGCVLNGNFSCVR